MANGTKRLTDGQFSWVGGVQSDTPKTKIIPDVLDDGVQVNQLSWGINCSMRGGGINQRPVLQPLVQGQAWSGLYQGGLLYDPDFNFPVLILAIGGRIYRVNVATDNSVVDLTAAYGPSIPDTATHAHFAQAEMFGIIQAGDAVTLPLFYDLGVEGGRYETLRQSNGIVNPGVVDANNELPASGPMDFYAQRLWYAYNRSYAAGDISGNTASGSAIYNYRDSVLKLTENPVAYAGDGFTVPTLAGSIRGLAHTANLDTSLGQSQLFVFTRKAVYACTAPITRDQWTAADNDTQPLQKVALLNGGAYGDRCLPAVNGDLFFVGPPDGDIRTLQTAQRYWAQWGSVPLSTNISRLLGFNDRALMRYSSAIAFDNRLLSTHLPIAIPGVGVGFQAIAPLDFDVISTFEERKPPAWEGVWDFGGGPQILQMFEGDFGGRQRAFAVVYSTANEAIEVWEIRPDLRFENGENRVTRYIEFPAYAFGDPMGLKELDTAELWIDKILGTIDGEVWFRPDSYSCWIKWHAFQKCAAKDCREDLEAPCEDDGYPKEAYCEQSSIPIALPKPINSVCIPGVDRPCTVAYQFQVRLKLRGWGRVRALIVKALHREERPYEGLSCIEVNEPI